MRKRWRNISICRERRALLDVGGGSGVMSIALAKKNPQLRATILDIEPVCKVAAGIIRRAGLGKRVRTLAGNIHDRLPAGYDVIMMCDIGPISAAAVAQCLSQPAAGRDAGAG